MRRILPLPLCTAMCALSLPFAVAAQCPAELQGGWIGKLPVSALFELSLEVQKTGHDDYAAQLVSQGGSEEVDVWQDDGHLRFQSERADLAFDGRLSGDGRQLAGFIDYASSLYRVTLDAAGGKRWRGTWSALPVIAEAVDLEVFLENEGADQTGAYFFFSDERLPGMFGMGASCSDRTVEMRERNLGLTIRGEFDESYSRFTGTVAVAGRSAPISFTPLPPETAATDGEADNAAALATRDVTAAPAKTADGWRTEAPDVAGLSTGPLAAMVGEVSRGTFPKTHSILVARSGSLVFEEYFHGYDRDQLHDMRSASKSLASTLVGLAVDRELIGGADSTALSFFPRYRRYGAWDSRKAAISLEHLMTMSSGLDANDSDPGSVASENAYQSQTARPDWIKLALDAPVRHDPGTRPMYGSANAMILGGVLANALPERVEWFAEDALFGPLGIREYRIYMDPTGIPYMGGGMYLRPRDMLKIGQLYLDRGRWHGRQILSASWVEASFGKYGRLEPLDRIGNEYGYLWWHETYEIDGRKIASVEARGNGGQYIFVVPGLELTAVITAGNYRGGLAMTQQPQRIFEQFILPAVIAGNARPGT